MLVKVRKARKGEDAAGKGAEGAERGLGGCLLGVTAWLKARVRVRGSAGDRWGRGVCEDTARSGDAWSEV